MKYLLLLFFALPLFSACQEQGRQVPEVDPETLTGMWVHSYEEDTSGHKVYRPEDYPFPPARGREGFEIRENGVFFHRSIAPADGYLIHEGRWELVEGNILRVRFEAEELRDFSLEIFRLVEDMLVVKEQG